MSDERVEELKREERVIRAWIRDVSAGKQARLVQIRAELRAIYRATPAKPAEPGKGVAR